MPFLTDANLREVAKMQPSQRFGQPWTQPATGTTDYLTFFSTDCYHFSQKGNALGKQHTNKGKGGMSEESYLVQLGVGDKANLPL